MSNEDQLDITEVAPNNFELSFPYQEDYIAFLKALVPKSARAYDEDTHIWAVRGEKYIGPLESVGLQRFRHVTRIYRRNGERIIRNVRTGTETAQRGLFV